MALPETTLLLHDNDIPKLTAISGNLDIDKLKPYIYMAQKIDVKRVLGINLYNKIVEDFENDALTGLYETIYNEFVVDLLVYYSAAQYVAFGGFQIDNGGIFRHQPSSTALLPEDSIDKLITRFNNKGASIELVFNDWIKSNPVAEYPIGGDCSGTGYSQYKFPWHF